MAENPPTTQPKADMPPPRKPPGGTPATGAGDDRPQQPHTVRIALPPRPTAEPPMAPPTKFTP